MAAYSSEFLEHISAFNESNEYFKSENVERKLIEMYQFKSFDQAKEYFCHGERQINEAVYPNTNRLEIDYSLADPERFSGQFNITHFRLFSFYLALIDYMTCRMNLTINFVFNYDGYLNKTTFIMDAIPFSGGIDELDKILIYDTLYQVVIMTALKTVRVKNYFSFIFLFDWIFWLSLVISSVTVAYMWKVASESDYSFNRAMLDIIRTITTQSSNSTRFWTRLRNRSKWVSLFILMNTWFLIMNIITKWMTGLLLDSYLPPEYVPYVNGIKDLVHDDHITILKPELLYDILDDPNGGNKKLADSLIKRGNYIKQDVSRKDPFALDDNIINDIVHGKSVVLYKSVKAEELLNSKKNFKLILAEEKYGPTINVFWVNENVKYKIEIIRLLQRCLEIGLNIHMKKVENMRFMIASRLKRQKRPELLDDQGEDEDEENRNAIHQKNANKDPAIISHVQISDTMTKFVISVHDISMGVLPNLIIGLLCSIITFCIEPLCFYYNHVHSEKGALVNKQFKAFELQSFNLDSKSPNTILNTFKKKNDVSNQIRPRLHPILQDNYELYFI